MTLHFAPNPARSYAVLVGDATALSALTEFAIVLQSQLGTQVLMLIECATAGALKLRPSTVIVDGMPPHVIACVAELAALGLVSRVASQAELPGCFAGSVSELLAHWLATQDAEVRKRMTLYVYGPSALCDAVNALATRYEIDHQQQVVA